MPLEVSFKNSHNLTLRGTLWQAPSDAIIIMAHGSPESNRFARGLFEPIAQAFNVVGYNVLAFDFAGHGDSDDTIVTLENTVDDIAGALSLVKKQGYNNVALFGHSMGAYACLKVSSPEVKTMVLLGALTGPVSWSLEDQCTPEELQEIREKGYLSVKVEHGKRNIVTLDGNILKDIAGINQQKLLSHITCPVLIIHGDADQHELDLFEFSKKALPLLPKGSELKIIHGASHTFLDKVDQVIALTKAWFHNNFSLKK